MPAIHGGIEQKLALKSVQGRTLLCCLNPLSQVKILERPLEQDLWVLQASWS